MGREEADGRPICYLQDIKEVEAGSLDVNEDLALLGDGVWDGVDSHLVDRGQCLFNENGLHCFRSVNWVKRDERRE